MISGLLTHAYIWHCHMYDTHGIYFDRSIRIDTYHMTHSNLHGAIELRRETQEAVRRDGPYCVGGREVTVGIPDDYRVTAGRPPPPPCLSRMGRVTPINAWCDTCECVV